MSLHKKRQGILALPQYLIRLFKNYEIIKPDPMDLFDGECGVGT